MPELHVGDRHWPVVADSNLLDALNQAGFNVPYSCRAGSCHACLVRCVKGEPVDAQPEALSLDKRREGWRLACQCRVSEDLSVEIFDPARDGLPANVLSCDWLSPSVLRLRVEPERPLRYQAGQHMVLWIDSIARPYSLASLPGEDAFLEFHIDCRRPGAFCDAARRLRQGDRIRLGELRGGALHYDPDWQAGPLLLLAAGTGLGPLWGILREALRQEHQGVIHLMHLAHERNEHYLIDELHSLAQTYPHLQARFITAEEWPAAASELRLLSRRAVALVCGGPASVENFAKSLYLAGVPRNRVLADAFIGQSRAEE
jgi:NAD(P)H-flavin reductase/ferredoxin